MRLSSSTGVAIVVATATVLLAGCSAQNLTSGGMSPAIPARHTITPASTVLLSEPFAGTATISKWFWTGDACLTAGTLPGAPGVIPACSNPPQDAPGDGALQLTSAAISEAGFVGLKQALPTSNGLDIQFELASYGGSAQGADGTLVWFSSPGHPATLGQEAGSLGYLKGVRHKQNGMHDAYLGIGFDQYGNYGAVLPGGAAYPVPNTVAIGGAQSTGYRYLGGYTGGSGQLASMLPPFELYGGTVGTRSNSAVAVDIQLTAAGNLQVTISGMGGSGGTLQCYSGNIVGISGQPAVPSSVFFGFASTTGSDYAIHDVYDLTISTLN